MNAHFTRKREELEKLSTKALLDLIVEWAGDNREYGGYNDSISNACHVIERRMAKYQAIARQRGEEP